MGDRPGKVALASASSIRRQLLVGTGLHFDIDPAVIDEAAVAATLVGLLVPDRARALAEAKALAVTARRAGTLVIGADQMLEVEGEVLSKASDEAGARRTLARLRGRAHHLHSGVALARDQTVIWSTVQSATLHVRDFSEQWLDEYIANAGEALTASVGAYQLEGRGVQLFERIDGDYFTILGLPLLPLLAELRSLGVIKV